MLSPPSLVFSGFCAGRSRFVLVALCVISLTSLTIIIALSIQLSLVTQQYDETSMKLEILEKEHDHKKSSLTSDILRKDLVAQELQESLKSTKLELERTKNDLSKSREEGKSINFKLERTLLEKAEVDTTVSMLRGSLQNTEGRLQGKTSDLIRCENNLRSANWQKTQDSQTISDLKNSLSTTERKWRVADNNLSQRQRELSNVKKTVSDLQEEQRHSQLQQKKLNDLEERLSVAEDCLSKSCDNGENYEGDSGTDAYCPDGWKQINETCYYFSSDKKIRHKADADCKTKNATLAKIQESDATLKATIQKEKKSFWIGLTNDEKTWKWPDGTVQENFRTNGGLCAKASPTLDNLSCSANLPWICQKKAMKCRLGAEDLRCFLEKIGVFGEKIIE
ncbi:CD209 antigen-like [Rana temporaria]|uniref:CD209 antigen-like n=1 Tax=Rana temporaria TaxID=8407 RepID=UPI001AAD3BEF|nr:CD209 antigen-like [Rana temporaria]